MVRCMERFMHRCRVSIIVFACALVAGVFAPVARAQQASQAPVAAPAAPRAVRQAACCATAAAACPKQQPAQALRLRVVRVA
jgi:hypothetical protein